MNLTDNKNVVQRETCSWLNSGSTRIKETARTGKNKRRRRIDNTYIRYIKRFSLFVAFQNFFQRGDI